MTTLTVRLASGPVSVALPAATSLGIATAAANRAVAAEQAAEDAAETATEKLGQVNSAAATALTDIAGAKTGAVAAVGAAGDTARQRTQIAQGYASRAALLAAPGAVDGDTSVVLTDAGTHVAVAGEVVLGGSSASVGASIPNEGRYTRTAGAWLRTGDSDRQRAALVLAAVAPKIGPLVLTGTALTPDTAFAIEQGVLTGAAFTRMYLQVTAGTGTVQVAVLVDGSPVTTVLTATTVGVSNVVSFTIPVGARAELWIGTVTGAPTALFVKLEGPAA